MTYDELPYHYKNYAKEREWEHANALAYWQQGTEIRAYMEHMAIRETGKSMGNREQMGIVHNVFHWIRGHGPIIS